MPRNGQGQYNLPTAAGNPVQPLTGIATNWANPTLNDIASALTQSVSTDGQAAMSGTLNLGNNKISNLATGTLPADGVNFAQVFTSPTFSGTPTAPTPAANNNSTAIATTAFVANALAGAAPFYEGITNVTTPLATLQPMDLATNQILYSSVAATNTITINFRGNATTTLATYLPAGNSITGVVMVTNTASPFFISGWQIDGVATVPRYLFGNVLSGGTANAIDIYSFSILRATSGAYTLLLAQQYYA